MGNKLGDWDWYIHTTIYKIGNLKQPTAQYSIMTYVRKESKKEWIYIYIYTYIYTHTQIYI